MRRLSFFPLSTFMVGCAAVAFSPGTEILIILTIVALAVTVVLAVPWTSFFSTADHLTGHGHIHRQAVGLGAGGRHGPPRSILSLFLLIGWALILAKWSRIQHVVMKLASSAGHRLKNINMSAQPLPS